MQGNTPQYRKLLIKNLANPDGSKLKPPKGKTATIQDSALLVVKYRGTQREYSSKPLKHSIVKRILVFKR